MSAICFAPSFLELLRWRVSFMPVISSSRYLQLFLWILPLLSLSLSSSLDRRSLSPVRALLEEYEFASGVDFALKIFIHSDRNWRSPALSGTKCAGALLSYARCFPSGPHFPYFGHKGLLGLMASTLRTFGCSLRFLTLLLPVHGTNQATHAMGCEGDKDHCVEQIRF